MGGIASRWCRLGVAITITPVACCFGLGGAGTRRRGLDDRRSVNRAGDVVRQVQSVPPVRVVLGLLMSAQGNAVLLGAWAAVCMGRLDDARRKELWRMRSFNWHVSGPCSLPAGGRCGLCGAHFAGPELREPGNNISNIPFVDDNISSINYLIVPVCTRGSTSRRHSNFYPTKTRFRLPPPVSRNPPVHPRIQHPVRWFSPEIHHGPEPNGQRRWSLLCCDAQPMTVLAECGFLTGDGMSRPL